MNWYPNKPGSDDELTLSQETRLHQLPGDDDPTIARPGLSAHDHVEAIEHIEELELEPDADDDADADADPTLSRPTRDAEPAHTLLDHRYQLVRMLGKGGMGEVWEARHVQLARSVAIKFLTHEEGGDRFKREAQAIVSIRHSGVVDVLDFGETERGVPYFVMELLEGQTLAARVRRQGPLSWAFVRNIALEVSDALAHAHAAGVVHRDLKPSNVIVLDSPPPRGSSIKLIDFGIAKLLDANQPRLTKTGYIQGTPAYMSPEQVLGEAVDGRADVYGLGCLLYYLISGRKPFAGKTGTAALRAQLYELPPSFAEAAPGVAVPPDVEAVIFRAIAKDPHARFQSMTEMQAAILAIPPDASASISAPSLAFQLHASESTAIHPAETTLTDSAEVSVITPMGSFAGASGSTASMASQSAAGSSTASMVYATGSSAALEHREDGRSIGEKIGLAAAIVGSVALLGAAIYGLYWALTS